MASTVADHRKPKNRKGFSISVTGAGGVLILGGALIAIGAAFLYRRCRANKKTPPSSSSHDQAQEVNGKQANDDLIAIKPMDDVQVSNYDSKTMKDDMKAEEVDGKETNEIQGMEPDDVVKTIVADIKTQELKVKEADDLVKTIEVREEKKRTEEMQEEEANYEPILPVIKLEYDDEEIEATETAIDSEKMVYNENFNAEADETESSASSTEAVWPPELIDQIESQNENSESETVELQANEGVELLKEKLEEKIAEGVEATKMAMTITGKYDYVNVLMHFLALLMVVLAIIFSYVASFSGKE